jgi:hypothetical protein
MAARQSYFPEMQSHGLLVDTEALCDGERYGSPATPPLSTSGSIVSSPGSCEVLQTPLNPMFSGLEFEEIKEEVDLQEQLNGFAWSNNGSASPVTPVYLPSQQLPGKPSLSSHASDIASAPSSHSPSPPPFTPAEKADFCDPRTLTVPASANPTLAPSYHTLPTLCGPEEEEHAFGLPPREPLESAVPTPSFSFDPAIPDGLPAFTELSDLDSDCGDFTGLINFNGGDFKRPRTCSSAPSLHDSFCSQDADEVDPLSLLPTPDQSDEDSDNQRPAKKAKKETKTMSQAMATAAADADADASNTSPPASPESPAEQDSPCGSQNGDGVSASTSSQSNVIAGPPPQHRRGRKQSLTEDPTKQFKCDICNRKFRRQEHLKRHHRSLHTHDKPFKCEECGKTFSRSDNLSQHQRTHGSGSIQLDVLDNGMALPMASDPFGYGRMLFSIGAELPGSDMSSEEDGSPKKNKRKREGGVEM